jgi:hypothetical protein
MRDPKSCVMPEHIFHPNCFGVNASFPSSYIATQIMWDHSNAGYWFGWFHNRKCMFAADA